VEIGIDLARCRETEAANCDPRLGMNRSSIFETAARASSRAVVFLSLLCLFFAPSSGQAADLQISEVELVSQNQLIIRFVAEGNRTYTLLEGRTVDGIDVAVATISVANPGLASFTHAPATHEAFYRIEQVEDAALALSTIADTSPRDGERGVSVHRETIVRFTQPLAEGILIGTNALVAEFAGRQILARVVPGLDRRSLTLFYLEPLPAGARLKITVHGDELRDELNVPVDVDGDQMPGGMAVFFFDTTSSAAVAGTVVVGQVFASELVAGSDTGTNAVNRPLSGVIVTVDGAEESLRAVTGVDGRFQLTNAPTGRFFVHIDGRAIVNVGAGIRYPDLAYYPFVGKAWEAQAGRTNLAGGDGLIYLPLIRQGTLRSISLVTNTVITFPPSIIASNPALAGVTVNVPAGALFSDDGRQGGQVGIAPVPPDRLPGPLPPGLRFPLVITVQTDGPSNFGEPVPVCFPNLADPTTGVVLAPGAKSALWSFNHDTGEFEIVGSMTVAADGKLVCSDPGVGILAPGWHGVQQGTQGGGGPPGDDPDQPEQCPNPSLQPKEPSSPIDLSNFGGKGNRLPGSRSPPLYSTPQRSYGAGGSNPVLAHTGEKRESAIDLQIPGIGFDFIWYRVYRSAHGINTEQGNNWDYGYNVSIKQRGLIVQMSSGSGRRVGFRRSLLQVNRYQRAGAFFEIEAPTNAPPSITYEDGRVIEFAPFGPSPSGGKMVRMTDRNGNSLRFEYDSLGRLVTIIDTLNRPIQVAYNPQGFIASVTDFSGRSVRYTYYVAGESGGSPGDLKSVTTPVVVGTPNGNDFPEGKTTTYTYSKGLADENLNHNLLTITDPRRNDPRDPAYGEGPYVENVYATTTDPRDPNYDRVIRQILGGDVIDFVYVPKTPSPENHYTALKVIVNDRMGNVVEHFFDGGGRNIMIREFTGRAPNPRAPTTELANRPVNRLREDDPPYFETRHQYNLDAKVIRTWHAGGAITEYGYEGGYGTNTFFAVVGRPTSWNPSTPPRKRSQLVEIRRKVGTHPVGADQTELLESYGYDADLSCGSCGPNYFTRHTDARGNHLLRQYDDRGNLIAQTNRIASVVDRFAYNARGQLTQHIHPDNGSGHKRKDTYHYHETGVQRGYLSAIIVDDGGFNLTTRFEYDAVGNLIRQIAPRGHDTQYVFNALNQVVREISPEIVDGAGIRYLRDYHFDANNNLIRQEIENRIALLDGGGVVSTNPTWTTHFEYDRLDRLSRTRQEADPDRYITTEFTYDPNGNPALIRYGEATAGRQTNNAQLLMYDERNMLFWAIRAPTGVEQSTTQFDYDANRNQIRRHLGLEDGTSTYQQIYDAYNRIVVARDPMGNVTTNRYDPNGNKTNTDTSGELIDLPGSDNNTRLYEAEFAFDPLNRLMAKNVGFFRATDQSPYGDGVASTRFTYADNGSMIITVNDLAYGTTNRFDTASRLPQFGMRRGTSKSLPTTRTPIGV
jgi:YD repeat-containing protein